MNTNIILDGFNAMLKQLIASAVADAVKPLQARILALEDGYMDWKGVEHIVAKAVQPLQDRVIALEIKAPDSWFNVHDRVTALEINQTLVREGHNDLNEAVRNVLDDGEYIVRDDIYGAVRDALDGYDFVKRNEVIDLVDKVVENAIDSHEFDLSDDINEAIGNYDFTDIIEENMPDPMSEDMVQGMIDDALGNLVVITQR